MNNSLDQREAAIHFLTQAPGRVLISLLRSQTIDLYAKQLSPKLYEPLETLRKRSPDRTKVSVEAIHREAEGYRIILDKVKNETLYIADKDVGGYNQTLGGGLCNLSLDLDIILSVIDSDKTIPSIQYLSWQDSAKQIGAQGIAGKSRTSLIFQGPDFPKLIPCERGPSYEAQTVDPWLIEQEFYGQKGGFVFIGQEPIDSDKFEFIRQQKLKNHNLRVFWLVGANQLRELYTDFKSFFSVVDVVSLNLAEAAQFFGFEALRNKHRNADELRKRYAREISRRVLKYGASHVVITDGAKGASLARQARGGRMEFVYSPLIQANSIQVEGNILEDTGCGDSFAAAIGAYFLQQPNGFKLKEATNFAHYIAGIIFQRDRPHLTEEDREYVALAHRKAQRSSAFSGNHELLDRNECQIKPSQIPPRGPRQRVLVLILGGDPSDPTQPVITGAGAAVENLAEQCRDGRYRFAPMLRVVPRLNTNPHAQNKASTRYLEQQAFDQLRKQDHLCEELGNFDGPYPNGVLKEDLRGQAGVYLLRVSLLEALEILSSENMAESFEDIKFWHFATEKVDERLVWHAKKWGVSREQSQEIIHQAFRDYIIRDLGPQYRFSRAQATNREDFDREMTQQLTLRIEALLYGIFRRKGPE